MQNTILTLHLASLHNPEYVQMGDDLKSILTDAAADTPEIAAATAAFNNRMAAIQNVFVQDPASPFTAGIQVADRRRDNAIIGLTMMARANTYSHLAANQEAGRALVRAVEIYSDRISNQSLIAESASLTSLHLDFVNKPELAAAIATLGLAPWVTEMRAANDDFKQRYQERTNAYGDETPDTVRDLRRDADTAYRRLMDRITALHILNEGAAPWAPLASRINAMIEQYKTLIATHTSGAPAGDEPA